MFVPVLFWRSSVGSGLVSHVFYPAYRSLCANRLTVRLRCLDGVGWGWGVNVVVREIDFAVSPPVYKRTTGVFFFPFMFLILDGKLLKSYNYHEPSKKHFVSKYMTFTPLAPRGRGLLAPHLFFFIHLGPPPLESSRPIVKTGKILLLGPLFWGLPLSRTYTISCLSHIL